MQLTKHEREAKRLVRGLMASQDISYKELARRLESYGIELDSKALSTKINRGKFPLSFFLACLEAMHIDTRIDRLFTRE